MASCLSSSVSQCQWDKETNLDHLSFFPTDSSFNWELDKFALLSERNFRSAPIYIILCFVFWGYQVLWMWSFPFGPPLPIKFQREWLKPILWGLCDCRARQFWAVTQNLCNEKGKVEENNVLGLSHISSDEWLIQLCL